ncbi:hypothetical protein [Streptomyces californicus]|uniref:hypothetical protein n=1 Tax=Streptomyces californicus TaxID=67351 RepID=UPI003787BCCF
MDRNLFDPENILRPAQAPGLTQDNPMAVRYAVQGEGIAVVNPGEPEPPQASS